MACGGQGADGRWVSPKRSPTFLFPVRELSKVYRSKFLDALAQASQAAKLPADPASTPEARQARLDALLRHDWVVYAKTPPAGPEVVLDYLSRYTHRVAISNQRIVAIDEHDVHLSVSSDDKGGKRVIAIDGAEFVGRFLQHVLPHGFKRIRHYGLLSPALKTRQLAAARQALAMPAANPQACEDAAAFLKRVAGIEASTCPHCRKGRWLTIAVLNPEPSGVGAARAAAHARAGQGANAPCRGPP